MNNWTENEEDESIRLIKKGYNYDEISKLINRSPNSIRSKLRRLGYKSSEFYNKHEVIECLECGSLLSVEKHQKRKFCNNSCSAKYNNKLKTINIPKIYCINCDGVIPPRNTKYCNQKCSVEYIKKENYRKIENGKYEYDDPKIFKKYLIEKTGNCCDICNWSEINPITGNVPIQLDHIDGDCKNNNLDNLRLLCPNCHSLTPNYGALNKGNSSRNERQTYRNTLKKLSLEELIEMRESFE